MWLASLLGCGPSLEQARALTVAGCVAQLAGTVSADAAIPSEPAELSQADLELAARLVRGVRECRAKAQDAGAQ